MCNISLCIFALYLLCSAFHVSTILGDAQHPPLTISMILRDFKAYNDYMGHPDFNNELGDEKGITHQFLTFDKKPAYNVSKVSTSTTHGPVWFDKWYRDSEYCIELRDHIVLNWDPNKQKYVYYNDSFFPLDGRGWGNEGKDIYGKIHNFGFTAEFATVFTYQGTETFTFSGDDDVWVYVNGYRIVDLGGVHMAETQYVSLSQFASAASLKKGSQYDFNFFFAERHEQYSVFRIETSVLLRDCPYADACGVCNGNATVNKCLGVDCGNGTCDCFTGCCKCKTGWSQATACGRCTSSCGNGIIEPGEDCDTGAQTSTKNAPCCDKFCHFVGSGTMCSQTADVCKSSTCDGAGHCTSAILYNSTCVPKNPSLCIQEMCDGTGSCGVPLPAGSICDVSPKPCTQMVCSTTGTCVAKSQANGTDCTGSYAAGDCMKWSCLSGQCIPSPVKQGSACPGNSTCTTATCDGTGNCILYQNVSRCQSTNPCENAIGSCNSQTGACQYQSLANGATCSLPNRKNCATYSCQQGTCVARSLCPPSSCDSQPVCNLNTGNCDSKPSSGDCCGDGAVTGSEFCDDGGKGCCIVGCSLWASSGAICDVRNPCSNSTCDGFGNCLPHYLPSGTPCGDSGNSCTRLVCQTTSSTSVCTEVPQVGLKCADEGDCTQSTCNSQGRCTQAAKPDSTPCDKNTSIPCMSRICKKGTCNSVHVTDGTACGRDSCGALECSYGVCAPGPSYTTCPPKDACHATGVCDPNTGLCSNPLQPNGQSCPIPSNSSCQIWTCTNGACNASCVVDLPFCGNGIVEFDEDCDTTNNTCCVDCSFLPKGSACDSDKRKCTEDVCDGVGVCQHILKPDCSNATKGNFVNVLTQLFIILGILVYW